MNFIKAEQHKVYPTRKVTPKKPATHQELPDDSVSEITDLERDEILAKYTGENMS